MAFLLATMSRGVLSSSLFSIILSSKEIVYLLPSLVISNHSNLSLLEFNIYLKNNI